MEIKLNRFYTMEIKLNRFNLMETKVMNWMD